MTEAAMTTDEAKTAAIAGGQRPAVQGPEAARPDSARPALPVRSPATRRVMVTSFAVLAVLILFTALQYGFPGLTAKGHTTKDYDAFYVAGRMFWEGRLPDAYVARLLIPAQREIIGASSFMPWTYPPQFNLLTAALGLLPIWLGYLLLSAGSLMFYVAVLRRIAGKDYGLALLVLFPAVAICARTGQNGFLIGGLVGLCLMTAGQRRMVGGVSLALLTVKPHLVALLVLHLALAKRWRVFAVMVPVLVLLLGLSTLVFGVEIWPAFLHGAAEAKGFLLAGAYPLFRMVSFFSALETAGVPARIALGLQGVSALLAAGALVWMHRRGLPENQLAGLAVLLCFFVSPYAYDYDLPMAGMGFALLLADFRKAATAGETAMVLLAFWAATGSSYLTFLRENEDPLSMNFWPLLVAVPVIWRVLERGRRAAA